MWEWHQNQRRPTLTRRGKETAERITKSFTREQRSPDPTGDEETNAAEFIEAFEKEAFLLDPVHSNTFLGKMMQEKSVELLSIVTPTLVLVQASRHLLTFFSTVLLIRAELLYLYALFFLSLVDKSVVEEVEEVEEVKKSNSGPLS